MSSLNLKISVAVLIAVFVAECARPDVVADNARKTKPEIWLAPMEPNDRPGFTGASDYFELFSPVSAWRTVAEHVSTFQIYLGLLRQATDQQLILFSEALESRGIGLAVESPVLVDTASCLPGQKNIQWMLPLIQRLKQARIRLKYVVMAGPLADGHTYTKAPYCHRPIDAVAADAARTVAKIITLYPAIGIGETEPIGQGPNFPNWSELPSWFEAFEKASGHKVEFLHLDIGWGFSWQSDLRYLRSVTKEAHVKLGVIYDGDGSELSSRQWAMDVAQNEAAVEFILGGTPDHAVFQTWFNYPDHVLPEADPTSLTGIIKEYLRPPTFFHVTSDGRNAQLLDEHKKSISGEQVKLLKRSPRGQAIMERIEGTVPQSAISALLALRVHAECSCEPGMTVVELGDFTYNEKTAQNSNAISFHWNLDSWANDGSDARSKGDLVQLKVWPSDKLVLNGPVFPVRPGSSFAGDFLWNINKDSAGGGYIAIIFLGRDGVEVHRVRDFFRETFDESYDFVTDKKGYIKIPPSLTRDVSDVKLKFFGNSLYAPCEQQLRAQ